ncbi:hypothetical protein imdm_72 [gamma proteobacterium IMCC2047]|nr:hypothetical protein imdm_72 [gamma proteobacterium IMCC2047]
MLHQFLNRFSAHLSNEVITELFQSFEVLLVIQNLTVFQRGHAWVSDNKGFEVQHALDITQRHIQQHTNTGWQRFQEPNMGNRAGQFNVTHTLTTHFSQCNFYTTLFTDYTTVLEALVFTTQALVILNRAKNFGTEQAVTLRLELR